MRHQKCIEVGLMHDEEAENWVGIQVTL